MLASKTTRAEEKKSLDALVSTEKVLDPNSDEVSATSDEDTEGESLTESLQGEHDDEGKLTNTEDFYTYWLAYVVVVYLSILQHPFSLLLASVSF